MFSGVVTELTVAESELHDFNRPLPARPPPNYVPHVREVRELYMEDKKCAADYAMVVEEDQDVVVENIDVDSSVFLEYV